MTDSVYSPQLGDRPFPLLGADPFAEAPFRGWLKGALLGILATVLVAAPPAWEAASVPARVALSRSGLEGKARRAVGWVGVGSLMLAGVGVGLLAERAAHHPEWFNVYNRVVVDLTTHEAGGITHKDFDLACQIEVIAG